MGFGFCADDSGVFELLGSSAGGFSHGLFNGMDIGGADALHEVCGADYFAGGRGYKQFNGIEWVDVSDVGSIGEFTDGTRCGDGACFVDEFFRLDGLVFDANVRAGDFDGACHVLSEDLADAPWWEFDEGVGCF